ncbi:hypothetical protein JCM11251_007500 [Rhodosporidiobolus azoricus]
MSLKQELKAWEASFRTAHGRAPTKEDIKQVPDIAAKYKTYNKAKLQQADGGASSSKAATAAPTASTSSSANPPPPPVFKTPTKRRPSRSQPRNTVPEPSTSSDVPANSSPSKKRTSTSSASQQPTFVLANSPSKLRALAALHSTSGSPNKRASLSAVDFPAAGLEAVKEVTAGRSPQKAKNPFASPRKRGDEEKGMFGEFEKMERARMREKKKIAKEKKAGGGLLGKAATGQGAGWGAAGGFSNGAERIFSRTSSTASTANGMDIDEVDSFFGGSSQPSQPSQGRSVFAAEAGRDIIDDDDFLGPSPVKPSTSSSTNIASFFGLSQPAPAAPAFSPSTSQSQSQRQKEKGFKPLLLPSPPPLPSTTAFSQPVQQKPKLFSTSLRGSSFSTSTTSAPSDGRSLKRAPSSAALSSKKSGADEDDALLDDADDSFYADALDAAEAELGKKGKGAKGPAAKRKRVAAGAKKGKGKAVEQAEEETEEVDDGVTVLSMDGKRGEMVLEFEEQRFEGDEEEERRRDRVVVHARGLGGTHGKKARDRGKEGDEEMDEGDDEAASREVEAGDAEEGEGDDLVDSVTLLRPRPRSSLLPSTGQSALHTTTDGAKTLHGEIDTSSLPADLASVLSLRTSPQKKSRRTGTDSFLSEAKERQVARVLGEPGRRRRKGGLLDLADEEHEEEGAGWGGRERPEGLADEEENDDDWDEEVDGWKETGEAMDGYYSGDEQDRW